jgi:hypothetical protein
VAAWLYRLNSPRIALRIAVASGCLALALHAANVRYLLSANGCLSPLLVCAARNGAWANNDTPSYVSVAEQILTDGFASASYIFRPPGYPLLLAVAIALTGEPTPALWVAPFAAAIAAVAVVWFTFRLTQSIASTTAVAAMFLLWPTAYALTPLLIADAVHAYVALTASVLTWEWRQREAPAVAVLAALFWLAAQSLRPTFLVLPVLLPVLLWKRYKTRKSQLYALSLWLTTFLVPAFLLLSNLTNHGVLTMSAHMPNLLACQSVPRVKEELGMGEFKKLRQDCWQRYRWPHLEVKDSRRRLEGQVLEPGDRNIKAKLNGMNREAMEFFRRHKMASLKSFLREIEVQLLMVPDPAYFPTQRSLYPAAFSRFALSPRLGPDFMKVFWIAAFLGAAIAWSRNYRSLACFGVLCGLVVMLPAGTSHWVGARLRFPMDLLAMPMVLLSIDALARMLVCGIQRAREVSG